MFAEVLGDRVGNDRGDGHCQQLRENCEWLGESYHHRAVIRCGETHQAVALSLGVLPGAFNWIERPPSSALRSRVQDAAEAVHDVPRGEGTAVVELYAASEVECVGFSIRGNFPRASQSGHNLSVRGESHESVEDVANRSSGGYVGRKRRVERSRIVGVSRVDQCMARGRRFAAFAGHCGQKSYDENPRNAHDVTVDIVGRDARTYRTLQKASNNER